MISRIGMASFVVLLAPAALQAVPSNPPPGQVKKELKEVKNQVPPPFQTPVGLPMAQAFSPPPGLMPGSVPPGLSKPKKGETPQPTPESQPMGAKVLPSKALPPAEAARVLDSLSRQVTESQSEIEAMLASHQGDWSKLDPKEEKRCRLLLERWRRAELAIQSLLLGQDSKAGSGKKQP